MTETQSGWRTPPLRAEQGTPRLVGAVWALLMVSVLGSIEVQTIIPLPRAALQVITMGALVLAFVIALVLNKGLRIRPSLYLLLLSLLLVVSIASSIRLESGVGALVRCFRFVVFLATLWLITRWWRPNLTFVRYHVRMLTAVLLSVVLGLIVAPGIALPPAFEGRLVGAVWPIAATQVGQYSAVLAGLTIVLWLTRSIDGRTAAFIALPAIGLLLLTHTRTAMIGFIAAVVVAGLSLVLTNARARRGVAWAAATAGLVAAFLGSVVQTWLARGQDAKALDSLTGRQVVWDRLLAQERPLGQQMLGIGLTDKSFGGLPIDSSWLSIYVEQGFVGIAIVGVILVALLVTAFSRPPSPGRACAIYLIVYCAIASYTEVGLGDSSAYMLHLAVAASLLVRGPASDVDPAVPIPSVRRQE